MGLLQALQQISGLTLPAFRDTGMRLREAEKLAQGCTVPGILNETRPACECDFPFPPPVLRSLRQTLRSELAVAGSRYSCRRSPPGSRTRGAVTGPLAPSGGRMKTGGGARPCGGRAARGFRAASWGPNPQSRGAKTFGDFSGGGERLGLN